MWRSLVARFVRDEEVVGSIPAIPTAEHSVKRTALMGGLVQGTSCLVFRPTRRGLTVSHLLWEQGDGGSNPSA